MLKSEHVLQHNVTNGRIYVHIQILTRGTEKHKISHQVSQFVRSDSLHGIFRSKHPSYYAITYHLKRNALDMTTLL